MSIKIKQSVICLLSGLIVFNPYLAWKNNPAGLVRAAEEENSSPNCYQTDDSDCMAEGTEEDPAIEKGLNESQKKLLSGLNSIGKIGSGLDVFSADQPRLIMNPTDLAILKSKLDFSQAKALFGTADDLVLTKLANEIKPADASRAVELIKTALENLSDPRVKQMVNSALTSIENSQNSDLPAEEQNSYLQGAKDQIFDLAANLNPGWQDPKLEEYRNLPLDRRVLETLIYLVTPSSEGGAGHERIRVERIWKGFEQEGQSPKNHPRLEDDQEDPHSKGQALDIAEIDTIKCTLVKKKRLGKTKRIPQSSRPIRVRYQTREGAAEAIPPYGETMNDIFKNLASGNLSAALEELGLVSDLNEQDLKTASVDDISYYLGSSFMMSILQAKRAPNWSDMKSGMEALGAAYVEEEIGLPRGTFTGSNLDEVLVNLGRRDLEDKLRLPAGSLVGKSGNEILTSAGKKHWENQTEGGTPEKIEAIKAAYHSSMLDEALGLPDGSFARAEQGDAATYRQIGVKLISERFSNENLPRAAIQSYLTDSEVELPGWSRSSQSIIANNNPNLELAKKQLEQEYESQYKNQCENETGAPSWETNGGYPESNYIAAQYHCRKKFELKELPEASLISLAGLDSADFERIFKGSGTNEVFKHRGQKIFTALMKDSRLAQEKEQEFLAEHPEIQQAKANLDFRKTSFNQAQAEWQNAQKLINSQSVYLKNDPAYQTAQAQAGAQARLAVQKPSFSTIKTAVKTYQKLLDKAESGIDQENSDELKNQVKRHVRLAFYHLRAAIEGEYQPWGEEAEKVGAAPPKQGDENNYRSLYKKNQSLLGLIKDIKSGSKTPQQVGLLYGAGQAAENLNLPKNSFNFLFEPQPSLNSVGFFISVGKAKVEEISQPALSQYLAGAEGLGPWNPESQRSGEYQTKKETLLSQAEKIDRLLGVYLGATQQLADELAQENFEKRLNNFYQRVGRESLKQTTIAKATASQLGIDDQYLTPNDIYQMLSGSTDEVFKKIAGAKLDSELRLQPGRGWNLFGSQNKNEAELALAQISADYSGNLLGMAPFDLTGSIPKNMMASRMEQALGLLAGSVSQSQSLNDLVEKNSALTFSQAFRIPLPFSADYTREKFQKDLALAGQPETSQNKSQRTTAQQSLAYYSQAIKNRIKQINAPDSYWWAHENELFENEGDRFPSLSQDQIKEVVRFQQNVKQIDLLLYLPEASTQKFLSGEISLKEYVGIGAQKDSNLRYILKDSSIAGGKITQLTGRLAESLGLAGGTPYYTEFTNQISRLIDWGTNNPGDTSAISGQKDVFKPEEQIVKIFSLAADQEAGLEPGMLGNLFYAPAEQRIFWLREAGMKYFQNQFGLGDKITNYFKYNGIVADCRGGTESGCSSNQDVLGLVGNFIIDKAHLNPGNSQHQSIARQDAGLLIKGDTRILSSLTGAYLIDSLLNPQQEDNPVKVPTEIAPDYLDIRRAFSGDSSDQKQIEKAGNSYYDENFETTIGGLTGGTIDNDAIIVLEDNLRQEGARQKEAELRRNYQKTLQYKITDSQLYKLDRHIPAGFSQKMMEADENGKASALADLGLNYIRDDTLLGAIFKNNDATRQAVLSYVQNPSSENAKKIALDGFGAVEGFLNSQRVFGKIKIENGTLMAIYRGIKGGGSPESLKQMGADLTRIYKTQWKEFAFSWADEQLGIPVGTAKSIYDAYHGFEAALSSYKNASAAYDAATTDKLEKLGELDDAGSKLESAKDAAVTLVINLFVSQVFGEKLAEVDQKLGLVPGSMVMIVSTGLAYAAGALGPAGLAIAAAMFVLTNLFGTYKIKLVCSADGYYPGIESAATEPALNLGLGVFDGKNPQSYQAGVMRGAQAKVNDLISDLMDLGYHYKDGEDFSVEPFDRPDELTKPIQIITFRQEDLDSWFGSRRYREVFNSDPPSEENRQGIGISELVPHLVHIGF